ncbi:MAG: hypothetical protein QF858_01360 [Candidatus Pacebacteria bacterium]|nr:hypothetical protein [Candidatus Paceibacterota bacterium]
MARIIKAFIAILFFSTTVSAMASEMSYTCEVKHVYSLSGDGSLNISNWDKDMRGSSFSVSRETGQIIGEVVPTLMAKGTGVVNKGSTQNSFKAWADFGNQLQLIEVQEFKEGTIKPFVSASMGGAGIVTGVCK